MTIHSFRFLLRFKTGDDSLVSDPIPDDIAETSTFRPISETLHDVVGSNNAWSSPSNQLSDDSPVKEEQPDIIPDAIEVCPDVASRDEFSKDDHSFVPRSETPELGSCDCSSNLENEILGGLISPVDTNDISLEIFDKTGIELQKNIQDIDAPGESKTQENPIHSASYKLDPSSKYQIEDTQLSTTVDEQTHSLDTIGKTHMEPANESTTRLGSIIDEKFFPTAFSSSYKRA